MCSDRSTTLLLASTLLFAHGLSFAQTQISQLSSAQPWRRVQFQVNNVPAAGNRFDPDIIRLDATFIGPSGRTNVIPGFWFQNYTRTLSGGYEQLSASGTGSW